MRLGITNRVGSRLVAQFMVAVLAAGCAVPADKLAPVVPAGSTYRLGAGDQVRITTFGEPGLTGDFRVDDSGKVALPLAGGARAAGLTPLELAYGVSDLLEKSGLYKDAKVSVEVTQYRPIFILGEVAKPGQYAYQPGMTVLTAAAIAGGFTYRAVTNRFSIVRQNGSPGADGATAEGRAERDTALAPSDVVTVYERVF